RKKMGVLMHKQNKDLDHIIDLFEGGKIVPVIDKRYQLSEVPEALRYFGEGHARGKIVVTIACDDESQ
ncbi:MAG: zinc-binding dehydrogenase, partial [Halobacteriota archaeon]|nr:zinc-binding dehydrogenase [Halobacteriota archaeon]